MIWPPRGAERYCEGMSKHVAALSVACFGLAAMKVGQDLIEWDALWAFVGVAGLMTAVVISASVPLERAMATGARRINPTK